MWHLSMVPVDKSAPAGISVSGLESDHGFRLGAGVENSGFGRRRKKREWHD
jgi:hypothetical protein